MRTILMSGIVGAVLLVSSGTGIGARLAGAEAPLVNTKGSSTSTSSGQEPDSAHIIGSAALAASDPEAMSQVLDSSAAHGDADAIGGTQDTTVVPVDPGREPVWVGGSLSGSMPMDLGDQNSEHGTTPAGFGTTPQGFGTSPQGFGSSSRGFGSSDQGFGGTPSQPGSGVYNGPTVDYGHQLQVLPGGTSTAGSPQRP